MDGADYLETTIIGFIDTALAAQNAVVATESLCLGTVFVSAVRNHPEKIAAELAVAAGCRPAELADRQRAVTRNGCLRTAVAGEHHRRRGACTRNLAPPIPLGYGTQVDWLQNVLAAGRATLSAKGGTYEVTEPELIDAAIALPMLSPKRRRTFERVGIAQYLNVTIA